MNKKNYFYAIILAHLAATSVCTMGLEVPAAPSLSHYEDLRSQLLYEIDAILGRWVSMREAVSDIKTRIQSYNAHYLWEDPRESFWLDPDFSTALLTKFFKRFQSLVPDWIDAAIILDRPEVYQLVAYEVVNNPAVLERVKEKLRTIARQFILENKPIEQSSIVRNKINFMNFMFEHGMIPNLLFKEKLDPSGELEIFLAYLVYLERTQSNPEILRGMKLSLKNYLGNLIGFMEPQNQMRLKYLIDFLLKQNILSAPEMNDLLLIAAETDNVTVTEYLLAYGANPNGTYLSIRSNEQSAESVFNRLILDKLSLQNHDPLPQTISSLLNAGADVNIRTIFDVKSPLSTSEESEVSPAAEAFYRQSFYSSLNRVVSQPLFIFIIKLGISYEQLSSKSLQIALLFLQYHLDPNTNSGDGNKTLTQWVEDAYIKNEHTVNDRHPEEKARIRNYLETILKLLYYYRSQQSIPRQLRERELYGS